MPNNNDRALNDLKGSRGCPLLYKFVNNYEFGAVASGYDAQTSYVEGQIVIKDDLAYIAIMDTPSGKTPPNGEFWRSINGGMAAPYFDDAAGRDAYYAANQAELRKGTLSLIGNPVKAYAYNGTNWVENAVAYIGPKGDKGEQGDTGVTGAQGSPGAQGIPGLQGPKGDTGPTGQQGVPGSVGATGPAGPQGAKGETGAAGVMGLTGPAGPQGVPGPVGPTGATGQIGPQGPAGAKGETGATGSQGNTGVQGVQGVQGIQGEKGDKGEPGERGPKGETGEKGAKGDTGTQGAQGPQGNAGSPGVGITYKGEVVSYANLPTSGSQGDAYFSRADGLLYIHDGGAFPALGKGIPFQGIEGPAGPQGVQGVPGIQGIKGDPGPQGDRGDVGETGPKGDKGDAGSQGPAGLKGDIGAQGATGQTGAQGPAGAKGETGATGPQGETGATGPKGAVGDKGPKGDKGNVGAVFTPTVDESGNLSWANDGGLENPASKNIKGPKGDIGDKGPKGDKGDAVAGESFETMLAASLWQSRSGGVYDARIKETDDISIDIATSATPEMKAAFDSAAFSPGVQGVGGFSVIANGLVPKIDIRVVVKLFHVSAS